MASPLLNRLEKLCMIDALSNRPNYLAAKKRWTWWRSVRKRLRATLPISKPPAINGVDISPTFQAELDRACASRDPQQLATLKPDPTALSSPASA